MQLAPPLNKRFRSGRTVLQGSITTISSAPLRFEFSPVQYNQVVPYRCAAFASLAPLESRHGAEEPCMGRRQRERRKDELTGRPTHGKKGAVKLTSLER
ncbi:hypothetical protein E2C01_082394 [Portunus trituberculatus]|uniref:Uncharacterized protein n=1 Tax=Portunus trituberculatus TaxID=210409 RepID=A0A5B7IYZ8_PORTR|nr:hypothetical protein [Portunus trituberculatus]